jgi:Ser/Thr protein kinase RdoA (MazF antagonist)
MEGLCGLTGKPGKYVKAHILPAALTEAGDNAGALTQHGEGQTRPIRRWTSWYDPRLVTAEGEAILAAYDEWAIQELRRLKLVWSSWGPMLDLSTAGHTLA